MSSLLAAAVQASKAFAQPLVTQYASGNRPYLVRLVRPATLSGYTRATSTFVNPEDRELYLGPARIHSATGGVNMEIGDERTPFSSVLITIDTYLGDPPRTDDVVHVLPNVQSQATFIAGRAFEVQSVEVGGHFAIGWVLQALGAADSRR